MANIGAGKIIDGADATVDVLHQFTWGDDSMWALQPASASPGTSTYTILASIKTGVLVEADYFEYRPTTATNVDMTNAVDSESFRFRYFAIKYTAGTATGTYDFWLEKKEDR